MGEKPPSGSPAGKAVDLSGSRRLPLLTGMMKSLSGPGAPGDAFRVFVDTMTKVFPSVGFLGLSTQGLPPGEYRVMQQVDEEGRVRAYWPLSRAEQLRRQAHRGGFLGELTARGGPQIYTALQVPDDPALGDALAPYRSLMAAPVYTKGEATDWAICLDRRPDAFDEEELEHLMLRANLFAVFLANSRIQDKLVHALDHNRRELERIAAIQRALLPRRLPDIPGVRLAASYETFDVAGGDMYDLHGVGEDPDGKGPRDGRWTIVIGDVSGHGPGAAVVMAMVEAMLMSCPRDRSDPAEALAFLNQGLCQKPIENSFVTLIVCIYDAGRRRLQYACAGHPPILLRRLGQDGDFETRRLEAVGGPPVGVFPESTYDQTAIDLQADDTLVFYTDGITESRSPAGEFFGVDGIERALRSCFGDAECVVDTVMEELKGHESGGRPQDDQTLLAMEITESSGLP